MSGSADGGIADPITANVHAETLPPVGGARSPLLVGRDNRAVVARRGKIMLAALYAIQVFYSFFVM